MEIIEPWRGDPTGGPPKSTPATVLNKTPEVSTPTAVLDPSALTSDFEALNSLR